MSARYWTDAEIVAVMNELRDARHDDPDYGSEQCNTANAARLILDARAERDALGRAYQTECETSEFLKRRAQEAEAERDEALARVRELEAAKVRRDMGHAFYEDVCVLEAELEAENAELIQANADLKEYNGALQNSTRIAENERLRQAWEKLDQLAPAEPDRLLNHLRAALEGDNHETE